MDLAEENNIGPDAAVQHFPVPDLSPFPLIETVYLLFAGNTSTIFHDHSFLSLPFAAGSSLRNMISPGTRRLVQYSESPLCLL